MVCLGDKPVAAGLRAQTNPLSYGGTLFVRWHLASVYLSLSVLYIIYLPPPTYCVLPFILSTYLNVRSSSSSMYLLDLLIYSQLPSFHLHILYCHFVSHLLANTYRPCLAFTFAVI